MRFCCLLGLLCVDYVHFSGGECVGAFVHRPHSNSHTFCVLNPTLHAHQVTCQRLPASAHMILQRSVLASASLPETCRPHMPIAIGCTRTSLPEPALQALTPQGPLPATYSVMGWKLSAEGKRSQSQVRSNHFLRDRVVSV
jgi:hypothetical protein